MSSIDKLYQEHKKLKEKVSKQKETIDQLKDLVSLFEHRKLFTNDSIIMVGDLEDSAKYYGAELTRIKNALLKGRFYAGVKSVSSSGMSRIITLAYIYKNKLHTIRDKNILALAGVSANGRIGGCGMDMLFHAQYTLFNNLHRSYKEAKYQTRMKEYNRI